MVMLSWGIVGKEVGKDDVGGLDEVGVEDDVPWCSCDIMFFAEKTFFFQKR